MLKFKGFGLCAAALLALAGCGGGSSGGGGATNPQVATNDSAPISGAVSTASRFVTVDPSGDINTGLTGVQGDGDMIDNAGVGFAYQAGVDLGSASFVAEAGVVGTDQVTALPQTGTLTYNGFFELVHVDRDAVTDSTAEVHSTIGVMSLSANLNTNSVTGQSAGTGDSGAPLLVVNGALTGTDLSGTARYRDFGEDMTGPLTGAVGADKAVGAFHGNNEADAFAGGFLVDVE